MSKAPWVFSLHGDARGIARKLGEGIHANARRIARCAHRCEGRGDPRHFQPAARRVQTGGHGIRDRGSKLNLRRIRK